MMSYLRGVVHGKTIELEHEPGLADGQVVRVAIVPAASAPPPWLAEAQRKYNEAWAQ